MIRKANTVSPCCLSLHRLHRSSSQCVPASQYATSTSHLPFAFYLPWLVVVLLLIVPPLPPILLTCNRLSACRLAVATPLAVPPLQLVHSARCCLSMHCLHLPLPFASYLPWLVVASLLVALPLPLILSTRCLLSTRQLVVALPLIEPPLQLILLTCHRLSTAFTWQSG
jgi:hypothetical protein